MIIDATEDDLRNVTEALRLASILDDRVARPDKARIAAYGEKAHKHRLTRDDLLDGVQAFYDSPSERPIGIGDLIHHARISKRGRLEREGEAEREQRRAAVEPKAADDDVQNFTAAVLSGRTKDTPRLRAAREALDTCVGKAECSAAITEFCAAKKEAAGKR